MAKSRLENVFRNSGASLLNRIVTILINFIIRTLFIRALGNEYTGISSLFTDILHVLSLVEMGLDVSMVYALYKPIAEKDEKHIAALMNFYRVAFTLIGISVLVFGLACVPFLQYIVKDVPNIKEDIRLIFIAYVVTTASSYFYVYKTVLIRADQKSSIISNATTYTRLAECLLEVILITVFREYFIYLILHFLATIIRNFILSAKAEKLYPEYLHNREVQVSKEERKKLFLNIGALIIYTLSTVVLSGTDSIFISAFAGTTQVAIVGNFTMITNSVKNLIKMIVDSTRPSVGNMIATDKSNRQFVLFGHINFLTFWVACFCSTCLFVLLNPFIGDIWFNSSYKVSMLIVGPIVLNFYIMVMTYAIGTFRNTNGLFVQGWYRPAVMSVLNIVLDFFMGKKWGVKGIYFATSISLVTTQAWYDAFIVFKHAFFRKPWKYYYQYLIYLGLTILSCAGSYYLCSLITIPSIGGFILKMLVAMCVPNLIVIAVFSRTDSFRYALGIANKLAKKVFRRLNK